MILSQHTATVENPAPRDPWGPVLRGPVRREEKHMRHYEAVIIFDTAVEPQAIQASLDRALGVINDTEGTTGDIDRWGRRPFAYEVKHKREGYYVIVSFTGEPVTVAAIDRFLGLADEVLRHKIIRIPDAAIAAKSA